MSARRRIPTSNTPGPSGGAGGTRVCIRPIDSPPRSMARSSQPSMRVPDRPSRALNSASSGTDAIVIGSAVTIACHSASISSDRCGRSVSRDPRMMTSMIPLGMGLSSQRLAALGQSLGSLLDAEQHLALHHQAAGLHHQRAEQPRQPRRAGGARRRGRAGSRGRAGRDDPVSADQPGYPVLGEEGEDPHPVAVRRSQREHVIPIEYLDPHRGAAGSERELIADRDVLELRQDHIGAVHVQAEQVLDPVIAVRAGPAAAHLDQPGPDGARRSADRDCPGADEAGVGQQLVPRQLAGDLIGGSAPGQAPGTPEQRVADDCDAEHYSSASHSPPASAHLRIPPTLLRCIGQPRTVAPDSPVSARVCVLRPVDHECASQRVRLCSCADAGDNCCHRRYPMSAQWRDQLGRFGIWRGAGQVSPELAVGLEQLGFGALWVGGSPSADLTVIEELLDATTTLVLATGIVNMWQSDADQVAASFARIEARHRGRFLLGVGAGHREASQEYAKPYATLAAYVDVLVGAGVPESSLVLAALGPKMLRLAARRTAGAHPYLVTPEYTR